MLKDLLFFTLLSLVFGPFGWIIFIIIYALQKKEISTQDVLLMSSEERVAYRNQQKKEIAAKIKKGWVHTRLALVAFLFFYAIFAAYIISLGV